MDDEKHLSVMRGSKDPKGLDRLLAFSDGVFAIAATLLIFSIKVPAPKPNDEELVVQDLTALGPRLTSVAISFAVIGLYWVSHHRRFRYIKRYDEGLLWINLVLLASIIFLPFATELIGVHSDDRVAVVVYGASLSAAGFVSAFMWFYASHNYHLIDREDISPEGIHRATVRIMIPPLIFLASTGAAFVHANLAKTLWYLPIPIYLSMEFLRRRETKKIERIERERGPAG
ncbi:MAG: TMEM175 family protein [Actinomycetota bacterium]